MSSEKDSRLCESMGSGTRFEGRRGIISADRTPTFLAALIGGFLLWSAFPPLRFWPLAWVAPIFWVWPIRATTLPGAHPYRKLYLAGFLHWLILIQWVRLPHWSAYFGWLALALYLACYLPLFVSLARVSVHRLHFPVVLAAPMVWTGLELLRGHLLTGFSLALLGHTQERWIQLIQISDLAGAYGVSFVVMLVAACLARATPCGTHSWSLMPLVPIPAVLALVLAYGHWRTDAGPAADDDSTSIGVALIQGSIDTQFGVDREQAERDVDRSFAQYRELTARAIAENRHLDLVVWPESMFTWRWPLVTHGRQFRPGSDSELSLQEYQERVQLLQLGYERKAEWTSRDAATAMLVGTEAVHFVDTSVSRYNSAILVGPQAELAGRYDKMHLVMFGEYVPLGQWLPWLYRLTPMPGGLTAGRRPVVFQVGGLRLSPSICFENTVPHLIRRQVARLAAEGQPPDVLVTLTNDGWFWGSSLLDLHLACGRFRAVEMRRPALIAANTGFSAWIDGDGRVRVQGPRRRTAVVMANPRRDPRQSRYLKWGDWPAGICLALCGLSALWGIGCRMGRRSPTPK